MLLGDCRLGGRLEGQRLGTHQRTVRGRGIDELECVHAGRMVVVVVDAEPLEQAMHERGMALAILHALPEVGIVARHAGGVVGQAEFAEGGFEDRRHRLVEMDAEVAAELTDGDVGHGSAGVNGRVASDDPSHGVPHDAMQVTRAAGRPRQCDGEVLPEQVLHGHVAAGGDQLHIELERPRERVSETQPAEGKGMATDR